jgi:hypothetical protein
MKLNKSEILNENLDFFNSEVNQFSYLKSENEHYRLLSYITKVHNNITIIDAGTCFGHSCLALLQNPNNKVITYDIIDKSFSFFSEYENLEFKKLDINDETPDNLKSAKIIVLDIDPHDGAQETKFINYLIDINYKGYVICDDIFLNKDMKEWWDSIEIEKHDITEVGHFSGTGLINFNQDGNFSLNV